MADDPLALGRETMRAMGYQVIDMLVERIAGLADGPVLRTASRDEMAARIDEPPPDGRDFGSLIARLDRDVQPFVGHFDHPRRTATVVALEYAMLLAFPAAALRELMADSRRSTGRSGASPRSGSEPADPWTTRYDPGMGRPLKVGVQLPEVEREVRWPEVLDMARAIEAAGYDSLWVGEHLLYRWPDREPRGPWEAWALMAALAAVTNRVEIGPLVACTAFHNPAVLAKRADTIDEISGGRFVLGLGAGWNETEFRAFGIPFDHRIDRFEEAFTVIRGLLRDGAIDFDGTYYQARDCELLPRGPRPAGPPLLIGSSGARMLRITMAHADAWNAWYADTGNSPAGIGPLRDRIDEACRDIGRDPAAVQRTVAVHVRMPGGAGRMMGNTSDAQAVRPLEGAPEAMAEELRAYAREGIGHVQLVLDPITRAAIEGFAPVLRLLDAA